MFMSREDVEFGENSRKGLIGGLILGGVALIGKAVLDSSKSSREQTESLNKTQKIQTLSSEIQRINSEIDDIDRQIANYKRGLLGELWNSSEIQELENQRSEKVNERNMYQEQIEELQ
jgi:chromosome segregation ATPase